MATDQKKREEKKKNKRIGSSRSLITKVTGERNRHESFYYTMPGFIPFSSISVNSRDASCLLPTETNFEP